MKQKLSEPVFLSKTKLGKRFFSFFLLLFLFAVAGCGQTSQDSQGDVTKIKVAFWGTPEEIDIITNSIAPWQKAHPEYKVVFEHTPYTGYASKILTRIAGGAAPDIITTEVDFFVTFATKGILEDLTPFIQADPEGFSKEEFFPQIVNRFTYQGKLLAVPRDVAPFACVFYNKKLFDVAGINYPTDDWTWDDLLRMARALTKKDKNGRIVQYGFYTWAWKNFLYGSGGGLVDNVENPTRTIIDSPESIAGVQFFADLINLYRVTPSSVTLVNMGMGVDRMFASGRVAMFGSGAWEIPLFRNYSFDWDVAMFPKGPNGHRAFGTGGSGYCILKSSKNKQAAWEVVRALTGAEGQGEFAKRGLAQPSRIAVAEGENWALHPEPPANKPMLNQALQYTVYSPFHSSWREIEEKHINPKLDLVFNGKKTAEETLTKLAPEVNALLRSE